MANAFYEPVNAQIAVLGSQTGSGGTTNYIVNSIEAKGKREPFSMVPFRQDPDFVNRPDIVAWIRENCAGPASRAALVGLGGVGKSQLAIQYCYDVREGEASSQTWVFWVHASSRARFEEAYRDIANRLELPSRNEPHTDILKLVRDWLCDESNGRWIMVVDNADDNDVFHPKRKTGQGDSQNIPAGMAAFLPQSSHGSILVTSRSNETAVRLVGDKNLMEVQAMNEGQAIQLLTKKLKNASDQDHLVDLVCTLDRIPLIISQAAAHINQRAPRMTIIRYLEKFKKIKTKISLLNRDTGDLRRDGSASNSVVTTWQMSFEQILKERPSAAHLLSLMSFFNPQKIPESVLRSSSRTTTARNNNIGDKKDDDDEPDDDNEPDDDEKFEDDLATLQAYSLVTVTAESDMCEMHPLVQFCTEVWLVSRNEDEQWRRTFLFLMANEFPSGHFDNWTKCQTLLPHVEPILGREPADEGSLKNWEQLLYHVSWYTMTQGNYQVAEGMAVNAIRVYKKTYGPDSPRMLVYVSLLALALYAQGKYKEAEEMRRQVLEGREKALGKDHPDTLSSAWSLALVLQDQGKYKEAEEMGWQVLEGREKALGKDHSRTLDSVWSLAFVLHAQGKYKEAEEIGRRAIEGSEKALGKDHPNTLDSVWSLAFVLRAQGKYKEAEVLYQQALEGREKVLGKNHPDTLLSVSDLASFMQDQGKYEAASVLYERASNGFLRVLGPEHLDTVECLGNYSRLRKKMEETKDSS